MTIYPVEFQRRLEQKWASRIEQILPDIGKTTPPRDPNDDDDDDEDEDKNPKAHPAHPAAPRTPDKHTLLGEAYPPPYPPNQTLQWFPPPPRRYPIGLSPL